MSVAVTEADVEYIRWLAKKVGCSIPFPEYITSVEASWLIHDLRMKLGKRRAYVLVRYDGYPNRKRRRFE